MLHPIGQCPGLFLQGPQGHFARRSHFRLASPRSLGQLASAHVYAVMPDPEHVRLLQLRPPGPEHIQKDTRESSSSDIDAPDRLFKGGPRVDIGQCGVS